MSLAVLTESTTDMHFMSLLLADLAHRHDFSVMGALGGRNAVRVLARSFLERQQVPVLVVADADSVGDDADETQATITRYLASAASQQPFKVVLFRPEFEIIFFETDELWMTLGSSLGRKIEASEVPDPGSSPRQALDLLLRQLRRPNRNWLAAALQQSPNALELLRAHPTLSEIRRFIEHEARQFDKLAG